MLFGVGFIFFLNFISLYLLISPYSIYITISYIRILRNINKYNKIRYIVILKETIKI